MDNKYIEQDHEEFVNSEVFQQMIKEKIDHSEYYKYQGIAPEGFTLIRNEVLEELKDFDSWKEFKNNPNWIEEKSKNILTSDI